MDDALKDAVRQHLRPSGFTGALPHIRRATDQGIALLSIQFFSSGGSFVVEVAVCDKEGFTTPWGTFVDPIKVRAVDVIGPRPRIGAPDFPTGDHWFVFGPRSYEPDSDLVLAPEHYERVAAEVMGLVRSQAEPFWADELSRSHVGHPPLFPDRREGPARIGTGGVGDP